MRPGPGRLQRPGDADSVGGHRVEAGDELAGAVAKFELLAENKLDEFTLSSPAISDGQIFLRTAKHLYCIGKK